MILKRMVRLTPNDISIVVSRNGREHEFTLRFTIDSSGLKGFEIIGLDSKALNDFLDWDEHRALVKLAFRFQEGENFSLPREILSDLPIDK